MRLFAPILIPFLFASVGVFVNAQVVARQGVVSVPVKKFVNFESPMILEIPLPDLSTLDLLNPARLPSAEKYRCEEAVSIGRASITKAVYQSEGGGYFGFQFEIFVNVVESHDRVLDIELSLRKGVLVIGKYNLEKFMANDRRPTRFETPWFQVSEKVLTPPTTTEPYILELSINVRHDD